MSSASKTECGVQAFVRVRPFDERKTEIGSQDPALRVVASDKVQSSIRMMKEKDPKLEDGTFT